MDQGFRADFEVLRLSGTVTAARRSVWEFPKLRGTLFGGPYNKDATI